MARAGCRARSMLERMTDEAQLNAHPVAGIDRTNGAVVVHLTGELDLYNAPEIRSALLDLCAEQPERIVVDLAAVDFVDSTALGVLIEVRTKLERRQAFLLASWARDPPRAHDLRPRPPSRRARHRRVRPGGAARGPELTAAARSRRCRGRRDTRPGCRRRRSADPASRERSPHLHHRLRKLAETERDADPGRIRRPPRHEERLREQTQGGRRYPLGTVVVKVATPPGKRWLLSWPPCVA